MRRLSNIDPSTKILGFTSRIPVFVSGAALAKLGHPRGESNITEGCGRMSLIQMVSSNASLSYAEIAAARVSPDQPLFFQLYKHKDQALALKRIREVESLGYKAIFLTVDAIVAGNRERDVRAGWTEEDVEAVAAEQQGEGRKGELPRKKTDMEELEASLDTRGTAGALVANDDRDMTWEEVSIIAERVKGGYVHIESDISLDNPLAPQRHQTSYPHQGYSVCRGIISIFSANISSKQLTNSKFQRMLS